MYDYFHFKFETTYPSDCLSLYLIDSLKLSHDPKRGRVQHIYSLGNLGKYVRKMLGMLGNWDLTRVWVPWFNPYT